jgi:hypothetical protein
VAWAQLSAGLDEEEQPGSTAALLRCSTAEGCQDPGELRRRRTGIEDRPFSRTSSAASRLLLVRTGSGAEPIPDLAAVGRRFVRM